MSRSVLTLLLLVPLAGCGRTGPPRPPGPPEAITTRQGYPAINSFAPGQLPPSVQPRNAAAPANVVPQVQDLPR